MPRPISPRLEPIPAVVAKAREAMKDLPINAVNVLATMAHNGKVARGVNALAQAVVLDGAVARRQVELAILRTGWRCRSEYEFGQHTLFGREAGLTDEEIYAITLPLDAHAWSDADRTVLRITDELYDDDCISDDTWAAATAHFSAAGIVQLIAATGCYRLMSAFLNSTGVERDDGVPGWPSAPPR